MTRRVSRLTPVESPALPHKIFAVVFGVFLGVTLLKFSTPPVMERLVIMPSGGFEWAISTWPVAVGFGLLGVVVLAGALAFRVPSQANWWVAGLPGVWLLWQFLASTQTVDVELTRQTLKHFTACATCFYLGFFCLNREGVTNFFIWPIAVAFVAMLAVGWEQHFGGLEDTRKYFFTYIYPTLDNVPPEYLKKMQSNRIFATVFYPNALAGALLLLLPLLAAWNWQARARFTVGARLFICGLLLIGAALCLYWSGSKGGWALALLLSLVVLLRQSLPAALKWGLIALVLFGGGLGLYVKNRAYVERGATSVVARFDYWRAAGRTIAAKPLFGCGPGAFGVVYAAIKKPESEMARLAHNDYLQQASDSGVLGAVAYASFVGGVLWIGFRQSRAGGTSVRFAVWLGLLGWALQSFGEFTLYIPAVAWPAFSCAGWLLSLKGNGFDKPTPTV